VTQADVPPTTTRPGDSIAIGQIGIARGGGVLRTFVGSCVGLVLHARSQQAAGLAHVMLPASNGRGSPPGKYADTAVAETLRLLREATGQPALACTAKLVGGATMFAFQSGTPIGEQNVLALERILGELGIPITGRLCGGRHGRRLTVDVVTGAVTVETAGHGTETLAS
jgi:chemotaxis protein CheD